MTGPTPLDDRRQRAREAFDDAMSTPSESHDGPLLMRAAERLNRSRESAIETAIRVRVDDDICDAAQQAFPIFTSVDEARPVLVAAFRAAGFEVEQ